MFKQGREPWATAEFFAAFRGLRHAGMEGERASICARVPKWTQPKKTTAVSRLRVRPPREGEPFKITLFCLPLPWHLGDFGGSFLTGDDTSGFKWRRRGEGKGLLISFGRIFFMPVCVKVTRGQWGRGNLFLPSTTPTLRPTITCTSFGGSHPSQ